MSSRIPQLEEYQKNLIESLRAEAMDLKGCFTRYSFQSFAIASVTMGLIVRFQTDTAWVGIGALFIWMLLLTVSRIGTYKYEEAYTLLGYQLHLERVRSISDDSSPVGWKKWMTEIGWEEAIRAWRTVQGPIRSHLYREPLFRPYGLRRRHRDHLKAQEALGSGEYLWCEPASAGSRYRSGGYLKTMINVLNTVALLSLIPFYAMFIQLYVDGQNATEWAEFWAPYLVVGGFSDDVVRLATEDGYRLLLWNGFLGAVVVTLGLSFTRWVRVHGQRVMIDRKLHSIHSCAILWQATVVAHFRALHRMRLDNGPGYRSYTGKLAEEGASLQYSIFGIHEWISRPPPPSVGSVHWDRDPARRGVSLSTNGETWVDVREGATVGHHCVVEIRRDGVLLEDAEGDQVERPVSGRP